jgi:hypothetical protein
MNTNEVNDNDRALSDGALDSVTGGESIVIRVVKAILGIREPVMGDCLHPPRKLD